MARIRCQFCGREVFVKDELIENNTSIPYRDVAKNQLDYSKAHLELDFTFKCCGEQRITNDDLVN